MADRSTANISIESVILGNESRYWKHVFIKGDATPSCDVNKKVIYSPLFGANISENEDTIVRAKQEHETLHALLTPEYGGPTWSKLKYNIVNLIEDMRIEKAGAKINPIFGKDITYLRHLLGNSLNHKISSGVEKFTKPLDEALSVMQNSEYSCPPQWKVSEEAQQYVEAAYPILQEWRKIEDFDKKQGYYKVVEIADRVIEALKQVKEQQNQNEDGNEKSDKNQTGEKEDNKSSSEQSGNDSDGNEDGEKKSDKNSDKKKENEKKQSREDDNKESSEGNQTDKKEEQNQDGNNSEEENNNSDKGDNTEVDSDGSNTGGENGDEDNDSRENGDESEDAQNNDSNGNNEDDADGDDDLNSESDQRSKKPADIAGDNKGERKKPSKKEKDKQIEEALNDDFSGEDFEEKELKDRLQKIFEKSHSITEDYKPFTANDEIIKPRENREAYEESRSGISSIIGQLSAYTEDSLKALSRCQKLSNLERGKIDNRKLASLSKSLTKKIFYKKTVGIDLDVAVTVMIDESGSIGRRYKDLQSLAIAFSEVFVRLKIKFEVLGYTTGYYTKFEVPKGFDRETPIKIFEHKNFNEDYQVAKYRLGSITSDSCNVDGESLMIAYRRIAKERVNRRIIFVLSDGMPNEGGGCSNTPLYKHLKDSVNFIRKSGTEVYAFGIGTKEPEKFYGEENFVYLASIKDLGSQFFRKFKQIVAK